MKVGDKLYECWLNIEVEGKSTIEYFEWVLVTVNKNGFYFRRKNYFTWGKLSKKNNDFGWLPNQDPFYRKHLKNAEDHKLEGLHKTKKSAYKSIMPDLKKIKRDILRLISQVEKQSK